MKGSRRNNNQIVLEVNRQIPVENADQRGPEMLSYRYNKTRFINSEVDQITDQPPQTSREQIQSDQPLQPYQRIKFVDCESHRPGKRRRVGRRVPKDTKLAVSRPVKNASAIHEDAWRLILAFATPAFLLNMRMVSRTFYLMLKDPSIWRNARKLHLDDSIPECPPYLSEPQYADLLLSQGCQSSTCLRRDTRKVYWVFGGRLCESCLRQYTDTDLRPSDPSPQRIYSDMFEDTESSQQFGTSLIDLIPTARVSGGKYNGHRPIEMGLDYTWASHSHGASTLMYRKSTYNKILTEFKTIQEEEWSPERVFTWLAEKHESAVHQCVFAARLEGNLDIRGYNRNPMTQYSSKEDRAEYFAVKASQLQPPMSYQMLDNMAAYHNAIVTPNAASERSWQILLPKILPYREDARRIEQHKQTCRPEHRLIIRNRQTQDSLLYKKLFDHRYGPSGMRSSWLPEQKFVIELAQDIFRQLDGSAADEDLILLCLRQTFDRYQTIENKPTGLNYDGTEGEYRLSLDDVKMVLEKVIQPAIDRHTLRGARVFDKFQCSGCRRHHVARRHQFLSCFEHIYQVHTLLAGEGLYYCRLLKNVARYHTTSASMSGLVTGMGNMYFQHGSFPYVLSEWTRTLPILPDHASVNASTVWDPNANDPYIEAPARADRPAFTERHALLTANIAANEFEKNFVYATKQLSHTNLNAISVATIALKYSLDLYRTTCDDVTSIETFMSALQATKAIQPLVIFRAKCGACTQQEEVSRHYRQANKTVDVRTVLIRHWHLRHEANGADWTTSFLSLPSDTELQKSMQDHDEQLRADQVRSVQRETVSIRQRARKLPDVKAKVLMEKRMASEVFNTLFVRNENSDGVRGISVRDLVLPSPAENSH